LIPELGDVLVVLHLGFQIELYISLRAELEALIHDFMFAGEKMLLVIPQASSTTCQIFWIGRLLLDGWKISLIS
jgi:hypothetical protein